MMMRALDLFCGAGDATRGLQQAGFRVTGVDLKRQLNYCGDEFVQADALDFLARSDFSLFGIIWASPPCQKHTSMKHAPGAKGDAHPDLITPTRELLIRSGLPYVIENVPGAPLRDPITLCGTMFGLGVAGMELQRHRLFEASFPIAAPECRHSGGPVIGIYGGHVRNRKRDKGKNQRSGSNVPITAAFAAMGIDWPMTGAEISEAIPPAYARHIAESRP